MISTVIFDLDGLLADTERLHFAAYRDTFSAHGFDLSWSTYGDHWVRAGKGIADFCAEKDLSLDIADIRREKAERYDDLVRSSVEPMPGAVDLLRLLQGRKRLALASASYRESVALVLHTLGIEDFFEYTAGKQNAKRTKPFPDVFLHVAAQLGVDPSSCVVLEDAEKGVLAAIAAGMKCVAVPNAFTKDNDFSQASHVVSSLAEINLELIDSL